MYAYRMAYDGRPFHGFQRQPDVSTVEDALLDGLAHLGVVSREDDVPTGYSAAGRTDAGVSAIGQTIAFSGPDWLTPQVLNGALPNSVHAWARAEVPESFHARYDAILRVYTYRLLADRLDEGLTRQALSTLSGVHDFRHLTSDTARTRRVVHIDVTRDDRWLCIEVAAPGFARQQVRRIVGVASAIGAGEVPLDRIGRLLSAEPLPGHLNVAPAPPEPLCLRHVRYGDVDFAVDSDAMQRMQAYLKTEAGAAATRSRSFEQAYDWLNHGR